MNENITSFFSYLPSDIVEKINSSKLLFSKEYERDSAGESRELKIHLDNAKISGITICGGKEAIEALEKNTCSPIKILAGKNRSFFFKIYMDSKSNRPIAYIMIRRQLNNPHNE